ncbi:MAG: metal ABC transporter ATP-binding protein [Negativicutes bacterium]|nr:metal ABC transporter ATP-binding protein [Negativicutes bacterium]
MNAFEFENVSFAYSDHNVFTHINLKMAAGDFVAVVGGNGAGKSTLLKLCVGTLQPDCGQVRIFGQPMAAFREWYKVGYVPQNPLRDRAFPATVGEIVAMGRVARLGVGRRLGQADHEIVARAMELVGVGSLRSRMIGLLSGGQQQRVMVARALAAEPEVLILDEPTAGVDAKGAEEFYALLRGLHKDSGITVLIVSHDVDRMVKYASTIANLEHGLQYYGPASRFYQPPRYINSRKVRKGDIVNHA